MLWPDATVKTISLWIISNMAFFFALNFKILQPLLCGVSHTCVIVYSFNCMVLNNRL
jgi:hypothetical protein